MRQFFGLCWGSRPSDDIDSTVDTTVETTVGPTLPTEGSKWPIIVAIVVIAIVLLAVITILVFVVKKRQTNDKIPENGSKVSSIQSSTSSRPKQKGSITEDIDRYHNRFIDSATSKESATEQLSKAEPMSVRKSPKKAENLL